MNPFQRTRWPWIKVGLTCLLALISSLLTSCAFQARDWKSSNRPGQTQASFRQLNGKTVEPLTVTPGQLVFVSCSVQVAGGPLHLSLCDGGRLLWEQTFTHTNDQAQIQVPAGQAKELQWVAEGHQAEGSFFLRYRSVAPKSIEVRVNRNIELFGLLMQMDLAPDALNNHDVVELGGRQAQWRDWYALAVTNFHRYQAFTNSPMMGIYRDYMGKGFYNDFFIGLLLQVPEVPHAQVTPQTDPGMVLGFSKSGNLEEATRNANRFLEALNTFYREIDFARYLADHQGHYAAIEADVRRHLPNERFIPTLETFYRKEFNHYCLVPSLNIPTSMGFGKTHHYTKTIYNVFGPFGFQSFAPGRVDLGFDQPDNIRNLSVHEFGHSFVNPAVDLLSPALRHQSESLFKPVEEQMKAQGYPRAYASKFPANASGRNDPFLRPAFWCECSAFWWFPSSTC